MNEVGKVRALFVAKELGQPVLVKSLFERNRTLFDETGGKLEVVLDTGIIGEERDECTNASNESERRTLLRDCLLSLGNEAKLSEKGVGELHVRKTMIVRSEKSIPI